MVARCCSSFTDRLALVHLISVVRMTKAQAASHLGFSTEWARKWWRRYCCGGEKALITEMPPAPGPLAHFDPSVTAAILAYRRAHPLIGARRARVALQQDPALRAQSLPDARSIHRAWARTGLVPQRLPHDAPPTPPKLPSGDPHAVWQIDHQDHIVCKGIALPLVLQSMRAPAAGITIGADVFSGPHGAHAVPQDDILDALRRRMACWGRPLALSVDRGVRFLGQPQRQFPSRLELFCAGLHIRVVPTRIAHPTDNGAVERLHWTLDAIFVGPQYADIAQVQAALDEHVAMLNERFPSRARACDGLPPLIAHPSARHSGRPYDPHLEWQEFDLDSVDCVLAGWRWHRQVGPKTGQISFANHNICVGKRRGLKSVTLRFDPADRQVVIYEPGTTPGTVGPEIKRFHCPSFDKEAILGTSHVATHPSTDQGVRHHDTLACSTGGTPL